MPKKSRKIVEKVTTTYWNFPVRGRFGYSLLLEPVHKPRTPVSSPRRLGGGGDFASVEHPPPAATAGRRRHLFRRRRPTSLPLSTPSSFLSSLSLPHHHARSSLPRAMPAGAGASPPRCWPVLLGGCVAICAMLPSPPSLAARRRAIPNPRSGRVGPAAPPPPARHGLFKGPVVLYSGWRVAGEGLLARARPPPPRFQPSSARASAAPAVGGRGPDGGVASSGRLARQHHLLVLLEAWPPSTTRVPCSVAG
jgi:hypothetical protein